MSRLQIDPSIHSAWISPTTLRFGIDHPIVVLSDPPARIERLVEALRAGMPAEHYPQVALAFGVNALERDELLEKLRPTLLPSSMATSPPPSLRIHLDEDSAVKTPFVTQLIDAGHRLVASERAELVILTSQFACMPSRARTWMTQGVIHLPVVFGESSVSIGPLVGVNQNPCTFCAELSRVDADPAWPAIASQCMGKRAPTNEPAMAGMTVAVVVDILREWSCGAEVLTNERLVVRNKARSGFALSRESLHVHPKCDCQTFAV